MLDFAQRFAAADPATTPPDAPLPDEALALLDRVMTPRAPHAVPGTRPAPPRPRRWRMPRLAIAILAPALLLATLAAMGWFGWLFGGPAPGSMPVATPAPAIPSWSAFTTEQELVDASDAILIADTLGAGTIELDGDRYWLATVQVVSSGKGDFAVGQNLQVTWPAAEDEGAWPAALELGNRALLFLTTPGSASTSADLLDPLEGVYLITDDYPEPIPEGGSALELDASFLDRMGLRVP